MRHLFPVIASTIMFVGSSAARADFITNGGFEAVQISTPFSTNPADIPGWTHSGDQGDALLWHSGPQCCGGTGMAKAGEGDQFVTMGGGFGPFGSSAWSQNVTGLTIGDTYIVSFLMAAEGETPTQQLSVDFLGGSTGSQNIHEPTYEYVVLAKLGVRPIHLCGHRDVGHTRVLRHEPTVRRWPGRSLLDCGHVRA